MKPLILLFALTTFSGTLAALAATVQSAKPVATPKRTAVAQDAPAVRAPKPIRVILASPY